MVNISLRDKETWHDRRPSHRKVPKAVRDALEHSQNCAREYNEHLNQELNKGEQGGKIDWTEVIRLADRANEAESALRQARHDALNPQECTCTPVSDACPACEADNRERYGDDIPFRGE